ncbi:proline--tRNA ligase [Candidatus Woesearchaeota archaeon]|nr:proline--tRNA ligase [Candidatus Woesearchaeota archaeon]
MAKEDGITVKKNEDMPEWYSQVIIKAELADYSPIKGCMVIRPNGYAIWQKIMDFFNERIAKMGVSNAYFPMFIPEAFFKKEAEHAEGFSPEVAWVEKKDEEGQKLALRPTSETIMYDSYSRWIRSWRDLPLRINQWCNIVRWEVSDVKLFLRSREFLWQEGHCVYETEQECDKEVMMILEEYRKVVEELLAVPVILGKKTEKERFAGAKYTTTMEAFMPDGKALQMGTSHNLGQGFAKVFGISFLGKDEKSHLPWQSSWGFSTRLIGAAVMTHSDDKGLVLPPRVAPIQAVIVPIIFEKTKDAVLKEAEKVKKELHDFEVKIDLREEYSPGWKFNEWEVKGVPVRIEIGPKDVEKKQLVLVRRDTGEKKIIKDSEVKMEVKQLLDDIQKSIYDKAKKFLEESTVKVDNWDDFMKAIGKRKLVLAPFCGEEECEDWIKDKTGGATSRCIPFNQEKIAGNCVQCKNKAKFWTYFAKNY